MLVPLERPNFRVRFDTLEDKKRAIGRLADKTYSELGALKVALKALGEEISSYPDESVRTTLKQKYANAMAAYYQYDKADNALQKIYLNAPDLQPYGRRAGLGYQTGSDDRYLEEAREIARVDSNATPRTLTAIKIREKEIVNYYEKMQGYLKEIWDLVSDGKSISSRNRIYLPR